MIYQNDDRCYTCNDKNCMANYVFNNTSIYLRQCFRKMHFGQVFLL